MLDVVVALVDKTDAGVVVVLIVDVVVVVSSYAVVVGVILL